MSGTTNDTDQRILTASIQIIRDKGEEAISLRHLASTVGVTTGAFYKHYANKEQLFLAMTKELSHQISEQARTALTTVTRPEKKLLSLADILLVQFQTQPNLMNFLFFNPTAQRDFMQSKTNFELLDMTTGLIDEILKERHSDIDPQNLFIQIWSFIQGYGLLIRNKIVTYDKKLVSITLDNYLGGN